MQEQEKPEPLEIYVVRHGETMLNVARRMQGWVDAPLTPRGEEGARDLGRGLESEGVRFDAVYTSDTGRAQQTAALVLSEAGQEDLIENLVADRRLREASFGTYEGMAGDKIFAMMAEAAGTPSDETVERVDMEPDEFVAHITNTISKWDAQKNLGETWPAESYQEIKDRAVTAVDEIGAKERGRGAKQVLVVAHGITISVLLASLGAKDKLPHGGFANTSVSLVTYNDGSYVVKSVNDTSYLEMGARKAESNPS